MGKTFTFEKLSQFIICDITLLLMLYINMLQVYIKCGKTIKVLYYLLPYHLVVEMEWLVF